MKKTAILLLGLSLTGCEVNTYAHPSRPLYYNRPYYVAPPPVYYNPPVYRPYYNPYYRPYYRPYY